MRLGWNRATGFFNMSEPQLIAISQAVQIKDLLVAWKSIPSQVTPKTCRGNGMVHSRHNLQNIPSLPSNSWALLKLQEIPQKGITRFVLLSINSGRISCSNHRSAQSNGWLYDVKANLAACLGTDGHTRAQCKAEYIARYLCSCCYGTSCCMLWVITCKLRQYLVVKSFWQRKTALTTRQMGAILIVLAANRHV